jgi:hypothetical protein
MTFEEHVLTILLVLGVAVPQHVSETISFDPLTMRFSGFVQAPRPWYALRGMNELLTSIAAKNKQLDELRPVSPQALTNLEHYYDIELTYTSNAIEGNTLSPVETGGWTRPWGST